MSRNRRKCYQHPDTNCSEHSSDTEAENLWLGMCGTAGIEPHHFAQEQYKSLVSIITNFQVYRSAFRICSRWINTVHVVNIL